MAVQRNASLKNERNLKKNYEDIIFVEIIQHKHKGKTHKKESNKNEKNQEIYLCQKNCL